MRSAHNLNQVPKYLFGVVTDWLINNKKFKQVLQELCLVVDEYLPPGPEVLNNLQRFPAEGARQGQNAEQLMQDKTGAALIRAGGRHPL